MDTFYLNPGSTDAEKIDILPQIPGSTEAEKIDTFFARIKNDTFCPKSPLCLSWGICKIISK